MLTLITPISKYGFPVKLLLSLLIQPQYNVKKSVIGQPITFLPNLEINVSHLTF